MTLAAGTKLGHYEIVSPLGAGGMGEVYRARDTRLGREVAIKVVSSDRSASPDARRRFEQEARAIALLSHPNILAIHEFDTQGDVSFAVTELLDGESLAERIRRNKLPWREAVGLAIAVCEGLAAAHRKGIIHRDVKPANIFISTEGNVKILDFGLARADLTPDDRTDVKTSPGTIMGTAGYMSPEQVRGEEVNATTDIFAIGCTLYEMIAGRSPFSRRTVNETNAAILHDEAPEFRGTDATSALSRVIRRCLEKNRAMRYQSAADLALDLRSLLAAVQPQRRSRNALIGISASVAIAMAVAFVIFIVQRRPATGPADKRSVVVMPFENGTKDANVEYLSDGIAEGLIDALAELPGVRVVARTTAFRFKGKPLDLPQLRRKLQVDAVLSGRVVAAADAIVVQVDLVDAATGTEIWGGRFHEQNANVWNIEREIVSRISDALRVRLTPALRTHRSNASTRNPEAYRLYLQGRFYWNKRNAEAIRKARELFEQAIAADPRFALAYSGLADACTMLSGSYRAMPAQQGSQLATEAAETAIRLDPDLAEGHASLGLIAANQFRWAAAEAELRRAIDINPNYANALLWYSLVLAARGRVEESLVMTRSAEKLDPLSAIMAANVANRLNTLGRFREALADGQRSAELDPLYVPAWWQTAMAYEGLGKRDKAAAMYREAAAHRGPPGANEAYLVRADVLLNNAGQARKLLPLLEERARRGEIPAAYVAWAYSAVGQRDKAMQWLEHSLELREPTLRDGVRTPIVRELRDDPRYLDLLARLARGFD